VISRTEALELLIALLNLMKKEMPKTRFVLNTEKTSLEMPWSLNGPKARAIDAIAELRRDH